MLVTRPVTTSIDRITRLDALPRIALELLHAEADALGLRIDLDDLYFDVLTDGENIGRLVDALPGYVGNVQQTVDAAKVNECTIIGDVLDDALDNLAFCKVLDQFGALFGSCLFHDGAARDNDVATALVHLEDLERLGNVHQRADVADRTDIHLAARQEGNGAAEVDGKAALDAAKDDAVNALVGCIGCLKAVPGFLAAGLVARQNSFTERVLDALKVDLDLVTDRQNVIGARGLEFAERDAAFGLEAYVNDGKIVFYGDYTALDDGAFKGGFAGEGFIE